jgi:hypothetical protein
LNLLEVSARSDLNQTTRIQQFKSAAWAFELNASAEVQIFRRCLINEAPNDETSLWHVVAAHSAGNHEEIVRLADEFLAAQTARDRTLGATLPAFQGDLPSTTKLAKCLDLDPSFWVREHACRV